MNYAFIGGGDRGACGGFGVGRGCDGVGGAFMGARGMVEAPVFGGGGPLVGARVFGGGGPLVGCLPDGSPCSPIHGGLAVNSQGCSHAQCHHHL